ncbi:MAG: 16S rRNA (adenine(1518)-N(6)/adenine(1519)-N(6))-dimethyltransferase RsmA [Nitrospirota bacterium]
MTNIQPRKSLGQNFLVDENVISRIVRSAALTKDDTVIEIGPGQGAMTKDLAAAAGKVIAIELDERLVRHLTSELEGIGNIELVSGDALAFPYESLACPVKVVANLPYYISTPIITRLLEARDIISSMTLMLQKEVAQRITAPPGGKEYGYMSVMVQFRAQAESLFVVPKQAFAPVPKVDSAVVRLVMREAPEMVSDPVFFERVVSASFSKRRKTLKNSLKSSGLIEPSRFEAAMERLSGSGIDTSRRAETLSLSEFALMSGILFENRSL